MVKLLKRKKHKLTWLATCGGQMVEDQVMPSLPPVSTPKFGLLGVMEPTVATGSKHSHIHRPKQINLT